MTCPQIRQKIIWEKFFSNFPHLNDVNSPVVQAVYYSSEGNLLCLGTKI